jgi:hypothetical protein
MCCNEVGHQFDFARNLGMLKLAQGMLKLVMLGDQRSDQKLWDVEAEKCRS